MFQHFTDSTTFEEEAGAVMVLRPLVDAAAVEEKHAFDERIDIPPIAVLVNRHVTRHIYLLRAALLSRARGELFVKRIIESPLSVSPHPSLPPLFPSTLRMPRERTTPSI